MLIADKAFDADKRAIEPLAAVRKTAGIPSKANRMSRRMDHRHLYKERHLIQTFFAKLKQLRAIATLMTRPHTISSPPVPFGSIDDTP
jgi:transposase